MFTGFEEAWAAACAVRSAMTLRLRNLPPVVQICAAGLRRRFVAPDGCSLRPAGIGISGHGEHYAGLRVLPADLTAVYAHLEP